MKIVILDGYTTNPGDVSWSRLEALGELTVYEKTEQDQILERAADAEIVLTNKTPLTEEIITKLPKLQYIGALSTGFNVIDLKAARSVGVPVCNVPSYCTKAVAQMTFALLMELTNHVALHNASVHTGKWAGNRDFCYWEAPLLELERKKMGIIGFGNIGRTVAQIALDFGMQVLVDSHTKKQTPAGCLRVDRDTLFQESDVISIHCPLTPETEGMIDRQALSSMKSTALLINTSRGQIIKEQDLADALNSGTIAGAAVDVLSQEPPLPNNPLLSARNCVITPHIAWAARESRLRLIGTVADNIEAFLQGKPCNVVNQ